MSKEEFYFESSGGTCKIRAVKYLPEGEPKAILQIAHGMVEFIDRYERFAEFLCNKGFLVVGNDHLGHGGSINCQEEWGYFAKNNGNKILLDDMYELTKIIKDEYPSLPYFLLGHSMGSFYARQYLYTYGDNLKGAIIMGTGFEPVFKLKAAILLVKIIALFKSYRYRSEFINNMAFGAYNKPFKPNKTRADWLTKDEEIVQTYINEPRCSFLFTLNGYLNMFTGIINLHNQDLIKKTPKDLPIIFVSGQDDPVGGFGKEVKASCQSLIEVGCKNVEMKLYPNDRHEILNELDYQEVYDDLGNWLIAKIK